MSKLGADNPRIKYLRSLVRDAHEMERFVLAVQLEPANFFNFFFADGKLDWKRIAERAKEQLTKQIPPDLKHLHAKKISNFLI